MTEDVVSAEAAAACRFLGLPEDRKAESGRFVIYVTADGKDEAVLHRLKSYLGRPSLSCPISPGARVFRRTIETMGSGGNVHCHVEPRPYPPDGQARDLLQLREDMKTAIRKVMFPGNPGRPDASE